MNIIKKQLNVVHLSLRLLVALLCASPLRAATVNAASPSLLDVSNAIASAAARDTVLIPAGASHWGTDAVTIRTPIDLIGAGTNATFIYAGHSGYGVIWDLTNDLPWRMSGITLRTTNATDIGILVGDGALGFSPARKMTQGRIDHVYVGGFDVAGMYVVGWSYGVLDSSYFYNNVVQWRMGGDQCHAWARPNGIGTTNSWYIEDCVGHAGPNTFFYLIAGDGGRYTFRHNVATNLDQAIGISAMMDAHGNSTWVTNANNINDDRGTVHAVIMSNVFINASTASFAFGDFRGGTCIIGSNSITSADIDILTSLMEEDAPDHNNYLTNWPGYDSITNSYIFLNRINGTVTAPIVHGDTCTNFVQLGRDYFTNAPSAEFYTPLAYPHPFRDEALVNTPTPPVVSLRQMAF